MKKIFSVSVLGLLMSASSAVFAAEEGAPPVYNAEWRSCTQTEDCMLLDTGCGWFGIAKKHRMAADAYYKTIVPMMDCEKTPKKKPSLECKAKQCTVGPGAQTPKGSE